MTGTPPGLDLEARARQSQGTSGDEIYRLVATALTRRRARGRILVDVGCGPGRFWPYVSRSFTSYVGVDAVDYGGFPAEGTLLRVDLNGGRIPLPDATADAVVGIETIEHLENPRAFLRELVRLARDGGWVAVSTPNQLSLLSLLTLIVRHRFVAFQDGDYPAHITALLAVDLVRIASECGLRDVAIEYSEWGRIPRVPWRYPGRLVRLFPRALSENLLMIGRKPS